MYISFNQKQSHPQFKANVFAPDECWQALANCKSLITKTKIARAKERFRSTSPDGYVELRTISKTIYKHLEPITNFVAKEVPENIVIERKSEPITHLHNDWELFLTKELNSKDRTDAEWRDFYIKASKSYSDLIKFRNI